MAEDGQLARKLGQLGDRLGDNVLVLDRGQRNVVLCEGCRGEDSPKLINVAAWQLLNQLTAPIPFVLGRREVGFDYPDIWHSPIPVWQLPEV
jgi:hypothetical protein